MEIKALKNEEEVTFAPQPKEEKDGEEEPDLFLPQANPTSGPF